MGVGVGIILRNKNVSDGSILALLLSSLVDFLSSLRYILLTMRAIYTEQKKKGILNLVLNYAFFI